VLRRQINKPKPHYLVGTTYLTGDPVSQPASLSVSQSGGEGGEGREGGRGWPANVCRRVCAVQGE
jgi:hypothetical protein